MKITINKHHTRKMNLKTRRNSMPDRFFKVKTDVTNVGNPNIQRDFSVLLENVSTEIVINLVILVACATRNKNHTRRDQDHPKHTKWPAVDYLHKMIQYAATQVITHQVMNIFACKWRYKLYKLTPMFQHPNICLQIWNSNSSCTRTKPSFCKSELTPAQM